MEFGISGEEAARGGVAIPPEMLRKQRGEQFEAKQAALGKRAITIVTYVAILLVLLIGGGAALTFTEYGVFGTYYWERWLPEAGDPTFARQAIEKSEKLASPDTYLGVKRSLKELGEARRKVGLNRELLTRGLLHESLFIVRFGDDFNSAAHAAAIMKRLEERSFNARRESRWRGRRMRRDARSGMTSPPCSMQRAPKHRAIRTSSCWPARSRWRGQAAGRREGVPQGVAARRRRARAVGPGAVALRGSDVDAQVAAVNETLKLSPMHVEARIAEARILWQPGKEDRALHLLRVAIGLEPTEEDQYLWTSKFAVALRLRPARLRARISRPPAHRA